MNTNIFFHKGLIILTSDGRLPNSVLRGEAKQPKTYEVIVDRPISRHDIEHLQVSDQLAYMPSCVCFHN